MVNVAIYCRISIEDKNKLKTDDSQSIQNQKLMLIRYAQEHNWAIFDIYCDDGYSGIDKTRPEFNRMLFDCKAGKINIVLCKDQSRFSRDTLIIEQYINDKFLEWGIRFIGVADNADSDSEIYGTIRLFTSAYNEMYVKDISGKIRNTLNAKRKQGQFVGSFAPYGYVIDPQDKHHLIVDETAALIVKQIFELYVQGWGYRRIVTYLNEQKIPSPALHKKMNNSKFVSANEKNSPCSGLWTLSTIPKILKNEMYTGTMVQGKSHRVSYKNKKKKAVPTEQWIRVPDTHESIITKELWEKAQERIKSRVRSSKIDQTLSPLSGKVRCAICGKPMKRNVYYNKSRTIKYYGLQCAAYKTGAMNCSNTSTISGLKLENIILNELNKLIEEYCKVDNIVLTDTYQEQLKSLERYLFSCQRKIEIAENRITGVYKDKLDGEISFEEYRRIRKEFEKELSDAKIQYSETVEKIESLKEEQMNDDDKRVLIKKYSHFTELTRTIVDEFVDYILIDGFDEVGIRKITITWKI